MPDKIFKCPDIYLLGHIFECEAHIEYLQWRLEHGREAKEGEFTPTKCTCEGQIGMVGYSSYRKKK